MIARVDGVTITLTKAQETQVLKVKKQRERATQSFIKVLKHFKFKKVDEFDDTYEKDPMFAVIQNMGNYDNVWLVGGNTKSSDHFPGGWIYESPQELAEELAKH